MLYRWLSPIPAPRVVSSADSNDIYTFHKLSQQEGSRCTNPKIFTKTDGSKKNILPKQGNEEARMNARLQAKGTDRRTGTKEKNTL